MERRLSCGRWCASSYRRSRDAAQLRLLLLGRREAAKCEILAAPQPQANCRPWSAVEHVPGPVLSNAWAENWDRTCRLCSHGTTAATAHHPHTTRQRARRPAMVWLGLVAGRVVHAREQLVRARAAVNLSQVRCPPPDVVCRLATAACAECSAGLPRRAAGGTSQWPRRTLSSIEDPKSLIQPGLALRHLAPGSA